MDLTSQEGLFEDVVREAGAIAPLVTQLAAGAESRAARAAAGALWNLAYDDASSDAVSEAGAIAPLVALFAGGCRVADGG